MDYGPARERLAGSLRRRASAARPELCLQARPPAPRRLPGATSAVDLLQAQLHVLGFHLRRAGREFENRQAGAETSVAETQQGAAGGVQLDLHGLGFVPSEREARGADRDEVSSLLSLSPHRALRRETELAATARGSEAVEPHERRAVALDRDVRGG